MREERSPNTGRPRDLGLVKALFRRITGLVPSRWGRSLVLLAPDQRLSWLRQGLLLADASTQVSDVGGGYWIVREDGSKTREGFGGLHGYAWTEYLREVMSTYRVDVVIDVGANTGQYATMLRTEVGFGGRIVSFEPLPGAFRQLDSLRRNDSQWSVINCALGSADDELEINEMEGSDFSSFRQTNTEADRVFGDRTHVAHRHRVPVHRLDGLWRKIGLTAPDGQVVMLKIDTQGWDMEVLKGTDDLSSMVTLIQTEVAAVPLYEGVPGLPETMQYLHDRGFDLLFMSPVSIEHGRLQVMEYDAVFINRRSMARAISNS